MSRTEISIDLPPPRKNKQNSPNHFLWILITVFALIGGGAIGTWFGKHHPQESSSPATVNSAVTPTLERKLIEARAAIAESQWSRAGDHYRSILKLDPNNEEAKASLPLIEKHLHDANGHLVITSEPAGAKVMIEGREPMLTPVEIKELPAGETEVRIEMSGFKPVVTWVDVLERQTTMLPKVALEKTVGKIELVSEPPGAEYKIIRTSPRGGDEMGELVKTGQTPSLIEDLITGEYEVLVTMAGWPPHSEKIKVEHNRSASVSAIFAKGGVNITSDPIGAEIWATPGSAPFKKRGLTPLTIPDLLPGRHQIEVRYQDWVPIRRTLEVRGNVTQNLEFGWKRSMVTFTSDPEGAAIYHNHRRIGTGSSVTPFSEEIPEGDYSFEARFQGLNSVSSPTYIDGAQSQQINFAFAYGSVSIESTPPGAAVIANGQPIGRTPLTRNVQPPGTYSYTISKENYKPANLSGIVEPGGKLAFNANLIPNQTPNVSRNFTNGVGQKMIWFNSLNGWVADTETLQLAYEMITKSNPSDTKNPTHPVDSVNWYDSTRYCETLTTLESSLGNVPSGYVYRLPTDQEWSTFAGEPSLTGEITSAYTRHQSSKPAGSAAPNEYGLYDIRGNLTEWVQDWFSQQIVNRAEKEGALVRREWIGTDRKVLRGGSWLRSTKVDLAIPYRRGGNPSQKDGNDVGFRVVLMPK